MRFILAGVVLVFAGFVSLGTLGTGFSTAAVEAGEFGTCYQYSDDGPPRQADCEELVLYQTLFFALVIGLIGAGIISLVKGARGDWDSRVKPGEMAGPGGNAGGNSGSPGNRPKQ